MLRHTFAFAMRYRFSGGTLGREEEQVHVRVDLRDDGMRNYVDDRQYDLNKLLQAPIAPLK